MSNDTTVATRLASAGQRLQSMSLLAEMLSGKIERQRREFQEIKSAITSARGQEESSQGAPGDIAPEMLG